MPCGMQPRMHVCSPRGPRSPACRGRGSGDGLLRDASLRDSSLPEDSDDRETPQPSPRIPVPPPLLSVRHAAGASNVGAARGSTLLGAGGAGGDLTRERQSSGERGEEPDTGLFQLPEDVIQRVMRSTKIKRELFAAFAKLPFQVRRPEFCGRLREEKWVYDDDMMMMTMIIIIIIIMIIILS
jgi:hypothetical protein